jgi:hypothetical protein
LPTSGRATDLMGQSVALDRQACRDTFRASGGFFGLDPPLSDTSAYGRKRNGGFRYGKGQSCRSLGMVPARLFRADSLVEIQPECARMDIGSLGAMIAVSVEGSRSPEGKASGASCFVMELAAAQQPLSNVSGLKCRPFRR